MTGQVKEDILSRFLQLGLIVQNGEIHFYPVLLKREEFLAAPGQFEYTDIEGNQIKIKLEKNSLAFTYCQIPVIYNISNSARLVLYAKDGSSLDSKDLNIDRKTSSKIFGRTSSLSKIDVSFNL
jgi:hypothetical protein